jgi:hypothetical protein
VCMELFFVLDLFLLNLFLCTAVTMVIVVYPPEFVADLLNVSSVHTVDTIYFLLP